MSQSHKVTKSRNENSQPKWYTIQIHCQKQYPMPEEIVLQLSHRDVFLSYFKERKQEILTLQAGDALDFSNSVFYSNMTGKPVAKLSANMQNTLRDWEGKGYQIVSTIVRFIVAWKPKDAPKDEKETAVLLADITLSNRDRCLSGRLSGTCG